MAVAPYSVCIQVAEPLFGLTASGLSFFFPYLSGRASTISRAALRRSVLRVLGCNLLLVLCGTIFLLVFGNHFLRIWAGAAVAHNAAPIFPLIVASSALSGFSVTGTYAAQALGLFRLVACISLGSQMRLVAVDVLSTSPPRPFRIGYRPRVLWRCFAAGLSASCSSTWPFETDRKYYPFPACWNDVSGRSAAVKILMAAAQFSSNISGLQRHAFNVVRCLLKQPEISSVHFVIAPWQRELVREAGLHSMDRVTLHVADMDRSLLSRNLWYYRRLPKLAAQIQPDVGSSFLSSSREFICHLLPHRADVA